MGRVKILTVFVTEHWTGSLDRVSENWGWRVN